MHETLIVVFYYCCAINKGIFIINFMASMVEWVIGVKVKMVIVEAKLTHQLLCGKVWVSGDN